MTAMLSHFSRVRLCAIPWTAAHQAPPSLGFSRQEYWSGLPFPSPMHVCMHAKSLQSCLTLCDPMDSSPPGSSVHGFSRQEYWSRLSCPPPRDLPNSGIESMSFKSPALARRLFITSATWEATQTVVLFHGFNRKPIQLIMPVLWMKLIDTEQVI